MYAFNYSELLAQKVIVASPVQMMLHPTHSKSLLEEEYLVLSITETASYSDGLSVIRRDPVYTAHGWIALRATEAIKRQTGAIKRQTVLFKMPTDHIRHNGTQLDSSF